MRLIAASTEQFSHAVHAALYNDSLPPPHLPCLPCLLVYLSVSLSAQEDWGRWFWGNLRGTGFADPGKCGTEGGVGPATQASAEDGSGCSEETPG